MASGCSDFEKWLSRQLLNANGDVDVDIFVTYISALLDDDTPHDDIAASLLELLSQVTETEKEALTQCILERWKEEQSNSLPPPDIERVDTTLSELLTNQCQPDSAPLKNLTDEQKAAKAAILNQYAEVCDGTNNDGDTEDAPSLATVGRNMNSESIAKAEREKREKLKQEAAAKKEKDKIDRATQKQKQQERKDGEKKRTQKGEKRR